MGLIVENKLEELEREVEYWRSVADYLAACHAATAEYEGSMSRVSAYRRNRYVMICETAAKQLRGQWTPDRPMNIPRTVDRCEMAVADLKAERK